MWALRKVLESLCSFLCIVPPGHSSLARNFWKDGLGGGHANRALTVQLAYLPIQLWVRRDRSRGGVQWTQQTGSRFSWTFPVVWIKMGSEVDARGLSLLFLCCLSDSSLTWQWVAKFLSKTFTLSGAAGSGHLFPCWICCLGISLFLLSAERVSSRRSLAEENMQASLEF